MNNLNNRLQNIPNSTWNKIAQIDELKGQWISGAKLDSQTLGRLKRSVLITSTGASTRIEGAKLSNQAVEDLIQGLKLQKFADRDKQEARGYYELLNNVFNSWESIKLSESTIKSWHKELLKYTDKDIKHCGDYKKSENRVEARDQSGRLIGVVFATTSAFLTPKEMQELVDWAKKLLASKEYHPLLVIAGFVVEFLKIHPFQDGNGRLSRILTNLLLLQQGYEYVPYISHEKLVEDNKDKYYLALRQSQKTFNSKQETIIPWLNFFLDILLQQSKLAVDLLSQTNIEKLLSPKQFKAWEYLKVVNEASPGDISREAGLARPTVNQILVKLEKLKKVERLGSGRATRYRVIK